MNFKKALAKIAESMKRRNVEIRLECDDDSGIEPNQMMDFIGKAKEAYPSAKVTAIIKF